MTLDRKNLGVLIVRRGHNMRVMFPVDMRVLENIYPPDVALEAIKLFLDLQMQDPGRADMPVDVSENGKPMGLITTSSEFVLDPTTDLHRQLEGRWEWKELDIIDPGSGEVVQAFLPCVVLGLDDIED